MSFYFFEVGTTRDVLPRNYNCRFAETSVDVPKKKKTVAHLRNDVAAHIPIIDAIS